VQNKIFIFIISAIFIFCFGFFSGILYISRSDDGDKSRIEPAKQLNNEIGNAAERGQEYYNQAQLAANELERGNNNYKVSTEQLKLSVGRLGKLFDQIETQK